VKGGREKEENLDRAELLTLHEHYANEIRTSLDLAHRNLSFYVGLLSAILAAVLAGLLKAGAGDRRVLLLLIGLGLAIWLAEVGYSTINVFYHRFINAYLTLLNVESMLGFGDSDWVDSEVGRPYIRSRYGGFIAQWADAVQWLRYHPRLDLESAEEINLERKLTSLADVLRYLRGKPAGFQTITLRDARRTMWAFELGSLLLVPAIIFTGLS
jgi:hypothetical protein